MAEGLTETFRMLDAFASVGATHFDVTFLDIEGRKRGFRAQQTARQIKRSLPLLLPGLAERQNNLIVRPHSGKVTLVQLDDLDGAALGRVQDIAFLTLQTSPGNHQAWVAVSGTDDPKDFARRLRKGTGADATASGATRVAGTVNYKRKYEPGFPTVSLVQANPGRVVTPGNLQALGLVARPEPAAPAAPLRVSSSRERTWPDYERCVAGAHLNHAKTGPDISGVDFFWCKMAAQRGWPVESIAAKLMQLSPKAGKNGESYALRTAENATAAASRSPAKRAR